MAVGVVKSPLVWQFILFYVLLAGLVILHVGERPFMLAWPVTA